jgi:ribosome-associated translation inhibitor RaiA
MRMLIEVNSDNHVDAAKFRQFAETEIEAAIGHYADRITRVEVQLQDVNAGKGGDDDCRCMMEARMPGRHDLAVTEKAASIGQAIVGAAEKLERLVEKTIGRLEDGKYRAGPPLPADPVPPLPSEQRGDATP